MDIQLDGTGRQVVSIDFTGSKILDLSTPTEHLQLTAAYALTDGADANQIDVVFHDTRTLAGGVAETLDLTGTLLTGLSTYATFARIKHIIIKNTATTASTLSVGGAANAWESFTEDAGTTLIVRPGGVVALGGFDATGYTVAAGTGDQLKITNNDAANAITYDIIIVGCSA